MLSPVRSTLLVLVFLGFSLASLGAASLVGCARTDPPPGTPADPGTCPEDAGSDTLPRALACCLQLARTSEDAKLCLAKADGG